jgi:hypothetical protein
MKARALLSLLSFCAALVLVVSVGCESRPNAGHEPAEPTAASASPTASPATDASDDPAVVAALEKIGAKLARNKAGAVTAADFSDAQVKAFDFAQLAKLPGLEVLELWGADVDDATLDKIAPLKLRELTLENTEITDAGLARLASIPTLRSLNLRRSSYLTDAALTHVAKLPNIEVLELLYNNFGDAGIEHVAKLPKLRVLDLRGCVLVTDAGLAHLAACKNLQRLKLRNPNVTDAGLKALRGLSKLRGIGFEDSAQISDQGLADLEGMPLLDELYLMRTNITD